jgi:hypothetical protein
MVLARQSIFRLGLVSAKQEINQINDKGREIKSTTDKPERNKSKPNYYLQTETTKKAK